MHTRFIRIFSLGAEVFAAGFLLNLAWEALHVPLYEGGTYLPDVATALSVWFWPTLLYVATMDAIFILGIYLALSLVRQDLFWLSTPRGGDFALAALLGFAVAWFLEIQGLALGKWGYGDAMPLVPLLDVGLTPLVQLAATALFAFFLVRRTSRSL